MEKFGGYRSFASGSKICLCMYGYLQHMCVSVWMRIFAASAIPQVGAGGLRGRRRVTARCTHLLQLATRTESEEERDDGPIRRHMLPEEAG